MAAPSGSYISKAACQAQQERALRSELALRADYPTVLSRCLRREASMTPRTVLASRGD